MERDRNTLSAEQMEKIEEESINKNAIRFSLSFLTQEARKKYSIHSIPMPGKATYSSHLFNNGNSFSGYFNLDSTKSKIDANFVTNISANEPPAGKLIRAVEDAIASQVDSYDPARQYFEIISRDLFQHGIKMSKEWAIEIVSATNIVSAHQKIERAPFTQNSTQLAEQAITNGLSAIASARDRADIFIETSNNTSDISFICRVSRKLIGDKRNDGRGNTVSDNIFEEYDEDVRKHLLKKVYEIRKKNNLLKQINVRSIIWFWWGCDKTKEVHDFIRMALIENSTAAVILESMMTTVYSSSGNYLTASPSGLNAIFSCDEFEKAANSLVSSGSQHDQEIGSLFLRALEDGKKFER